MIQVVEMKLVEAVVELEQQVLQEVEVDLEVMVEMVLLFLLH